MADRTPRPWPSRVGVWHRASRREPWRLLVHAGRPDLARRVMIDFAATGERGDYATAPADRPPTRFR